MQEMRIKVPHNVLLIDTADYERQLFKTGQRGVMLDPSRNPRDPSHPLSLVNLLQSLGVDVQCIMHNAGNEAFMGLLAFQLLLDPDNTKLPSQKVNGRPGMSRNPSRSPTGIPSIAFVPTPPIAAPLVMMPTGLPGRSPNRSEPRERRSSLLPADGTGSRPRVSSGSSTADLTAHVADMNLKHGVSDA
ncbi:hypothetical protein B0H21DRAFT_720558 [Amylocystis lapponica]|nr:hypothetical protein B0H21DRAFT_720558 [Amylocystis lapponica]